MASVNRAEFSFEAQLENLGSKRPEVNIPGYWETIEENAEQWAAETTVSPFWRAVAADLQKWRTEFATKTSGPLLAHDILPPFEGKKHGRILTKTVQWVERKGADKIFDADTPAVPNLNDLVRTRVRCAFMDGVSFFAEKLAALATELHVYDGMKAEGRLEGYFAYHVYFTHDVFFRLGGEKKAWRVKCEVQLATELSSTVWSAAHSVYERSREAESKVEEWQWNPNDPRFVAHQLGHMVHLADGLLVQLRDARKNYK